MRRKASNKPLEREKALEDLNRGELLGLCEQLQDEIQDCKARYEFEGLQVAKERLSQVKHLLKLQVGAVSEGRDNEEMERLRRQLNVVGDNKGRGHPDVLDMSRQLDDLIIQHMKDQQKWKKPTV